MQTLVIQTQYRENYAAHDEGYEHGVSEPYCIPTLTKLIESFNEGFEEYIIDWEIRDLGKNGDGKGPICESWEIPVQFYYEDKQWKCRTHHTPADGESFWNSAIVSRAEQWIPGEAGTRNNYKCQYKTKRFL